MRRGRVVLDGVCGRIEEEEGGGLCLLRWRDRGGGGIERERDRW